MVHRVAKNIKMNKKNPEPVVLRCSVKKRFLKILQDSQENTCAGHFLKKIYVYHNHSLPASQSIGTIFSHTKANFAILFSLENIKTKNGIF